MGIDPVPAFFVDNSDGLTSSESITILIIFQNPFLIDYYFYF